MSPGDLEGLKIFTLNCWGLRYFSQHRKLRIKLIAQHLSEHDYDIVFLQEVWIQSDFEYIRSKTQSRYTFAHMFNNASILGTSGLVIMAKWSPKIIHFHPYSINGSPFRPNHGDWFSTKGVAYVRIELKGYNLHLFCTHMHAQYDEEEEITDQYSIHRVCQSYELAKYINLMACNCSNPSSKDLIILAGDMNTSSKELPYRLLVELTGLSDCYKFDRKKRSLLRKKESTLNGHVKKSHISRLKFHTCSDESSDDELITCGHKDNTFTGPNPNPKSSKRIDFILYKLRDFKLNGFCNGECAASPESPKLIFCRPEPIKINAKDVSGLSYSDHQPVAARLKFQCFMNNSFEEIKSEDIQVRCSSDRGASPVEADEDNGGGDSGELDTTFSSSSSSSNGKVEGKSKKVSSKLKQKEDHQRGSSQWKQTAASSHQHHSLHFSSVQQSNNRMNSPLLNDIEDLLDEYISGSTAMKHLLTVGVVFLTAAILLGLIYFTFDLTSIEMILLSIILLIVCMFVLFLRFVTHRHEINAVKAILNDIHKKKTFGTDYGIFSGECH